MHLEKRVKHIRSSPLEIRIVVLMVVVVGDGNSLLPLQAPVTTFLPCPIVINWYGFTVETTYAETRPSKSTEKLNAIRLSR